MQRFRILGIPAGIGLLVGAAALVTAPVVSTVADGVPDEDYSVIPADILEIIEAAETVFLEQDADATVEYLAEDYSWYRVSDAGPEQVVKGREQTRELLQGFFSNNSWTDSEVQRLGMLGNMLVQVEVDHFEGGNGPQTIRSLNIYEFREGKRWREWKFYPADPGF